MVGHADVDITAKRLDIEGISRKDLRDLYSTYITGRDTQNAAAVLQAQRTTRSNQIALALRNRCDEERKKVRTLLQTEVSPLTLCVG